MFRKFALTAILALAFGASAKADQILTTTATVNGLDGSPLSNVNTLIGTSAGNFVFSNTIGTASPDQTLGATAQVVSIGADRLTGGYNQFGGGTGSLTIGGVPIIAVTAVQGTATSAGGGVSVFKAEAGKIALFAGPATGFNAQNPLTWGIFTDGTATALKTPLAVFSLASPSQDPAVRQLADGAGGNVAFSANNTIAFQANNPVNNTGDFTFKEIDFLGSGTSFLNANGTLDPNYFKVSDALHIFLNEKLSQSSSNDPTNTGNRFRFIDPAGANGATGLASLNTIANSLGQLNLINGFGFATVFGAGVLGNGFDPYNGPSGSPTVFPGSGDLGADFGLTLYPGLLQDTTTTRVPEPASIAAFALVLGAGAIGVRRRNQKVA